MSTLSLTKIFEYVEDGIPLDSACVGQFLMLISSTNYSLDDNLTRFVLFNYKLPEIQINGKSITKPIKTAVTKAKKSIAVQSKVIHEISNVNKNIVDNIIQSYL